MRISCQSIIQLVLKWKKKTLLNIVIFHLRLYSYSWVSVIFKKILIGYSMFCCISSLMLYSFPEMIIFVSCSLVFEVDLIECSLVVDLFLLFFFLYYFFQVGKPPSRENWFLAHLIIEWNVKMNVHSSFVLLIVYS